MAVFSKADFGLPVITQMVQVDAEDKLELVHLVAVVQWQHFRGTATMHGDTFEATREFIKRFLYDNEAQRTDRLDSSDPFYTPQFEDLNKIAEVCRLAQDVVTTLFEESGITVPQERRIRELDQATYTTFAPIRIASDHPIIYPQELLYFSPGNYYIDLWRRFATELREVVTAMIMRKPLRRCSECQNIFPVFDREAVRTFCSHRCAARSGERRRFLERRAQSNA